MTIAIDPLNLDTEQKRMVLATVKTVAEYLADVKGTQDSIKETLELVIGDLHADKDSAKALKKYIKTTARHYFKQTGMQAKTDNAAVEYLLDELDTNLVDRV